MKSETLLLYKVTVTVEKENILGERWCGVKNVIGVTVFFVTDCEGNQFNYHPCMWVGNVFGHVCLCVCMCVCLSICVSICADYNFGTA